MVSSIPSFALSVLLLLCSGAVDAFAPVHRSSLVVTAPTSSLPVTTTSLHGVGSVLSRVRDSVLSKERSREDLKIGIAGFYDRSSQLWEEGKR